MDFLAATPSSYYIRKNPSTNNMEFFEGGFVRLNIGTGGIFTRGRAVTINVDSADLDTIIRGDTDANLFFADASTDRVGVGTATPGYKLDVAGTLGATGFVLGSGGGAEPATAGATGTAGMIRWASGHLYICTATDTWKRAELLTW
jgi:hypothetical protein